MGATTNRPLFGQDLRARQVAAETPEVRQRAREKLFALGRAYRSVDEVYPDAEQAVREAVRDLQAASRALGASPWNHQDVARLARELALDFGGYGPLQPFLDDPDVEEIMVTGTRMLVIRQGREEYVEPSGFRDEEHVRLTVDRILLRSGRRLDESCPDVDTQIVMDDGTLCRVHAIIPPVSVAGTALTVRKFQGGMTPDQYLSTGALTPQVMAFLAAAVRAHLNIVVSGGTASGKTTLLNVLGHFIQREERIVTVEDALELDLPIREVRPLLTRPANVEGQGEVTIRRLVKNALRMRPTRIVVGEVRGGEALDMLQAMNTGHEGSMTTGHANSARDMLSRLETMVLMAGMDLPLRAVRGQIASAVDLVVHVKRYERTKRRVVTEIVSLEGLDGDAEYALAPLFEMRGDPATTGQLEPVDGGRALTSRVVRKLEERGEEEVVRRCWAM